MGLNNCVFIGRLTKEPEVRTVGEDSKVANFTIAVDRRFKSKDETQPKADFIPVTVWRSRANFVEQYFTKGKQVYVSGSLETYTFEKNDGTKGYGFRINADEVGFADSSRGENKGNAGSNNDNQAFAADPMMGFEDFDNEDDLPF